MFVNNNTKEDLYQFIIKRHSYYEAKLDILDDKFNVDSVNKLETNSTKNVTTNSTSNVTKATISEEERIENMIKEAKSNIEGLKKKMISEERNLLGLYKLKRK